MEFKFTTRSYQERAIQSAVKLFEGQPTTNQKLDISYSSTVINNYGNQLFIDDNQLLKNLNDVQKWNDRSDAPIKVSEELEELDYSVEMETGTGKTFVYLKTIVELAKTYGWKKYIIVVPSVAIKEGVKSEFDRLQHALEEECKQSVIMSNYDSKNINNLQTYYRSNMIEILLMTMQSFNSDNNVLNKVNYDLEVEKPIHLIQELNPIVILDEPQKMGGEATQAKLKEFHPLFTLRYSATHKELVHPIYRYTPIDAYRDKYVKKIEVLSVYGNDIKDIQSYVEVVEIGNDNRGDIYTKLKFYQNNKTGIKLVTKKVKNNFDLFEQSNEMPEYQGYKVKAIHLNERTVTFDNDVVLEEHAVTQNKDDIMKIQIYETIKTHLIKEKALNQEGIKVLSLFFIDKVVNFRDPDDDNGKGKIRKWFEEAYTELASKPDYKEFAIDNLKNAADVSDVMSAYFSQDKKGLKDTKGTTKVDEETYDLIMKNKEKLLSFDNPVRFIFSHSALREGWDNPNIFQICTLNETISETRKRQEIGRGLRLPVNQRGERIQQEDINVLTVAANTSYEIFAKGLQEEIQDDTGLRTITAPVSNARDKKTVNLRTEALEHPEFKKLWGKINKKTKYSIEIEDKQIIQSIVARINKDGFKIDPLKYVIRRTMMTSYEDADRNRKVIDSQIGEEIKVQRIPNVIKRIADYTGVTKRNIVAIIKEANITDQIFRQPDSFVEKLSQIIIEELPKLLKDGIQYEATGEEYQLSLFRDKIEVYKNNKYLSSKLNNNTLYEYVQLDSDTELKLIDDFSTNEENFKFFVKLPSWFKVPTPAGNYNPDWAIVYEETEGDRLYLVRESKQTNANYFSVDHLRLSEVQKIEYGKKAFNSIDVDFQVIEKPSDIKNGVFPFGKIIHPFENKEKELFLKERLYPMIKANMKYEDAKTVLPDEFEKYSIVVEEYDNYLLENK
ncbi:type III restriction enzyme [Enterococcus sp. DIV0840]|uniref:restriction endonuclease n=1 Tax=Enterococcus TaxID=1350 RepID=UPI001A908B75|nr:MULTISPECIES: DEAD/DEAH box helicase family protein [Enterococcus]MBO0433191.1 DEAD/DEAH box helicase family protein [Enterococcus sp. DIV0849a]MBO0473651.1 DEAD/DEAH box helicase family protein [Enterococcus ureasiticus]